MNKNGIISPPISFEDVRYVLGDSSRDLGTLCRSDKINILSKRKTTPYLPVYINETRQPVGYTTDEQKIIDGDTIYGISKPYVFITDNQYHRNDIVASKRGDLGFIVLNIDSLLSNYWAHLKPSVFRLADFDGYVHSNNSYPSGNSAPYSVPIIVMSVDEQELIFGAQIRYDYDDATFSQYGKAALLGIKSLFGIDINPERPAHPGVIMYAPHGTKQEDGRTDRTNRLVALYIDTTKQFGSIDPDTGRSDFMQVAYRIPSDHTSTLASKQDTCFLDGERVYVIPVLARRRELDDGWNVFSFAFRSPAYMSKIIKLEGMVMKDFMEIRSATVTFTVYRLPANNAVILFIAQPQDFVVNVYGSSPKLYFGTLNEYSFQAGIGGNVVQVEGGKYKLGSALDSENTGRYYTPIPNNNTAGSFQLNAQTLFYEYNNSSTVTDRKGTLGFISQVTSSMQVFVQLSYVHMDGYGNNDPETWYGTGTLPASPTDGTRVTINLSKKS